MALPEGLSPITSSNQLPEGLTPIVKKAPLPEGLTPIATVTSEKEIPSKLPTVAAVHPAEVEQEEAQSITSPLVEDIKSMVGVGEVGLAIITDFTAQGAAALAAIPYTLNTAINKLDEATTGLAAPGTSQMSIIDTYLEVQKSAGQAWSNAVGYHPRTATGVTYHNAVGSLFEAIRDVETNLADTTVDSLNSFYIDTKTKLASGELDPDTATGMFMDVMGDVANIVAPILGGALTVSIEAPLMLAPFAMGPKGPKGTRQTKSTEQAPLEGEFIPADKTPPKGSMLEQARLEKQPGQELAPVLRELATDEPLFLPPPKAYTIPPFREVERALAQIEGKPLSPKEVAETRASILNPMATDLFLRKDEIAHHMKNNPLPEGVRWSDEVAALKTVRLSAAAKQRHAKTEYFKDTYGIILKDIESRLDVARLADVMERRGDMLEWIAVTSVDRAQRRVLDNNTTINKELNEVFNNFVPRDTVEMGTKFEYGPDLRSGERVLSDLITTTKTSKGVVLKTPAYPDMGVRQQYFAGNLFAGKQVGQLHPLVKYAVDVVGRATTEMAVKAENFIFDTKDAPVGGFGTGLRFAKKEKGKEGAFTLLEDINYRKPQDIEAMRSAAYEYEFTSPTKEADLAWFEARGVTAESFRAYTDLRVQLERVRTYLNDVIINHNKSLPPGGTPLAPIDYLPSYLPHVWRGAFRVHVRSKGKHVQTLPASNKWAANKLAKEMEKEGFSTSVSSRRQEFSKSDEAINSFQQAIKFLADGSPEAKAVRAKYMEIASARGYKVHAKKRKNISGFLGLAPGKKGNIEFFQSNKSFIESSVEFGEFMKARGEINKVLGDPFVQKNYPNAVKQVNNYMLNASGMQGFASKQLDTAIRMFSNDYITGDMVRAGIGKLNLMALYNFLFFGNIRFFAMQGLQPHLVVPARLESLKAKGVKGDNILADLWSTNNSVLPSPEAVEAIKFGINQKIINPNFIEQFSGETQRYMGWQSPAAASIDVLSGRQLAGYIEEMTRMKAYLTFYKFFKDSGMGAKEAMESAGYQTKMHMVEYHTAERPLIFGESGLGTAGKSVGLFQTWQQNYLGQTYIYAREATIKNPATFKPLAMTALAQLFMGGARGVLGMAYAQLISEGLQGAGIVDKTIYEKFAEWDIIPDFLMYGVPSAATGIDMSTSLSAPSSIVESFIASPGMEFGTEIGVSAWSMLWHGARNGLHPGDTMRFWKSVAPSSMDGWIEAAYTPGLHAPVPNPKKDMRGEVRRDMKDWIPRVTMAAHSLRERKARDTLWLMQKVKERETASIGDLVSVGAKIWHQGNLGAKDAEIPDWMFDKVEEMGVTPREFLSRIQAKVTLMEQDIWEQVTNFGKTRAGREAMDKFNSLNGAYYGEDLDRE